MKIGSFLMIGLKGESLSSEEKNLIEKEEIGGVILFERNCQSYAQLKNLCRRLYSLRQKQPLLIAVDREGGSVDRLRKIKEVHKWPSPSLMAQNPLNQVEQMSFLLNQELKSFGINMNLSPCLDMTHEKSEVLKGRTFSKNPFQTAQTGKAVVQGAKRAGVLSCAKHFPGHGGVSEDSHLTLPVDFRKKARIMEFMFPFRQAVSCQVPAVMLAHLLYPCLDRENIAPFSKEIIQNLLRRHLGFKGLILTDDLNMQALSPYPLESVVWRAFRAGAQMMICGQDSEKILEILDCLKKIQKLHPVLEKRNKEIAQFKKDHLFYLRS